MDSETTADTLLTNERGIITRFSDASFMSRCLSMGIELDSGMVVERTVAFDGPRIISIGGLRFALRREELEMIYVK